MIFQHIKIHIHMHLCLVVWLRICLKAMELESFGFLIARLDYLSGDMGYDLENFFVEAMSTKPRPSPFSSSFFISRTFSGILSIFVWYHTAPYDITFSLSLSSLNTFLWYLTGTVWYHTYIFQHPFYYPYLLQMNKIYFICLFFK